MKLHDQDHQSKAVWRAIGDKRRSSDNPVIAAEDSAERGRLWQLHFSKLLGAVSVDTAESIDELPTGVHSAFNHCRFRVDMFESMCLPLLLSPCAAANWLAVTRCSNMRAVHVYTF